MDRSKKRALEILDLYLNEAKNLDFIKAIILVGSLSDDTYTGNAGSDIDLVHIVSDERDYKLEKDEITRIIGKIETQTGRAVPIAKAVYQEGQIKHPYKYDFEIKQENKDLLELPIEMFRIIDSGITVYGDDEIRMNIERPTREDIVEMKKLDKKLEEKASKDDPEWYKTVLETRENPSLRMMTQIVLTNALSDYMYYTDKSCSSKYYILQRMEEDYPELQYMNLLRLCHKYRFHPEKITTSDEAEMKIEYQNTFINRPETWGNNNMKKMINSIFKTDPSKVECINSIYQMSDMPDKVLDSEDDCYIGYEEIGEGYSGITRLTLPPDAVECSKLIAEYVKDGILLDLACGDGAYTVPCAKLGMKVIGGDISNKMMSLLIERAEKNNVSLDKVMLCRMNALDIPINDESIDCVIANSVLHLISHPEKVVDEIYRVLKKDGVFICFDDAPGRGAYGGNQYYDATGEIYRRYWEYLGKIGIKEKKYSWKFDRNGYCETKFNKEERLISWNHEHVEKVEDIFLPRLSSRGFSAQTTVPEKEHKEALQYALEAADKRFGEGWRKYSVSFTEGDMVATVFTKGE